MSACGLAETWFARTYLAGDVVERVVAVCDDRSARDFDLRRRSVHRSLPRCVWLCYRAVVVRDTDRADDRVEFDANLGMDRVASDQVSWTNLIFAVSLPTSHAARSETRA